MLFETHAKIIIMKLVIFIAVFLSLTLATFQSFASNGWVSSGGDDKPFNFGASWFNSKTNEVKYCLVINSHYSVKENELELLIDKSVQRWKNYYQSKLPYYVISEDTLFPNFNWNLDKKCNSNTQVKFYFDLQDTNVKLNKAKYYNPYSFEAFDEKTKTGLLWFRDLNKILKMPNENALEVLIMHELGHAFGLPHLKNTIMKENITSNLESDSLSNSIDGSAFLLYNPNMDFKITGKFGNPILINNQNESIFEKLTGRKSIGKIKVRVENPSHQLFPNIVLYVGDEVGEFLLRIDNSKTITLNKSSQYIFKTFEPIVSGGIYNDGVNTFTWFGTSQIDDFNGNHYPIFINIGDVFEIKMQIGNELKILFKNDL
jgi:hypothetical protein